MSSSAPALSEDLAHGTTPSVQTFPFPVAPPPWTLRASAVYWMVLKGMTRGTLPPGTYDPLEQPREDDPHSFTHPSRFVGGLGLVWVVRYTESPVGPYDELIYVPGEFVQPDGSKSHRITRIYVSSPASVWNGRRNWNIPKHLARFVFTPQPNSRTTRIEVFNPTPDESTSPFFAADVTLQRWVPAIPITTNWIRADANPNAPLRQGERQEECASVELNELLGSDFKMPEGSLPLWKAVRQETKGRVHVAWWSPVSSTPSSTSSSNIAPGEYADGVGFPKLKIWSAGIAFGEGTDITFGTPLPVQGPKTG